LVLATISLIQGLAPDLAPLVFDELPLLQTP
jgi:hypothetical protein